MLLKSINYWSMPGGLDGSLDVFEFMRRAKEYRFDAVEIAIGEPGSAFGTDVSQARCQDVLKEADRLGIKVASTASGLYWGRNLADPDPNQHKQAIEDLEKMIQITAWLGCKTLLTIPGAVNVFFLPDRPTQDYAGVWERATAGIKQVIPTAERLGVRMGIENVWNKFLLSPMEMKSFVSQFNSHTVGAYVDVANLLLYGYPEQWLRILGDHVVGIHFKDYRRNAGTIEGFVDLLEGDVDWPAVMQAIQEIRYQGPLVAEMIPCYQHYPMVRIANTSNAMDAILNRI